MVQHPKLSNFLNMTAMIVESYPEGKAFVTKTVEELLFKGFNLPFFDHLNTIFRELGWTPDEIEALWREVLPRDARDFRFAFYRDAVRNGTVDGPYLIGTGKEDPYDFGRIHLWHGESKHYMKPWSSEECNAINGTDGTLFPPLIHKETILQTFVTDLCRSMSFRYEKDVEFGVILGYRFVLHPDSVASVKVRPENECFCVGKCLGAGLLDVSKCFDGKPIVMSSPHFLIPDGAGDNGLNKSLLDGIAPMKDSHETFLDVEPVNGTLLRVKKRLQTNIKVRQVDGYKAFANLPEMEVPVFWTEESAELSQEESKEQRRRPKPPKPPSGYGSTDEETPTWAIGVGVGVVVLVIILRCICKKLN
ncbi:unnamed protein product [Darwinula stevensoni]|uniref:Uncharacterized protein n=1 Tax=Darwinula stevensoni TaxID=69355 RepID=A0A7R9ACY1_9CRUS|nr:unnamed protein product [Darwinula stevensoni]CAG0900472.1 unnamed protein product [Darwinula stevensoni]